MSLNFGNTLFGNEEDRGEPTTTESLGIQLTSVGADLTIVGANVLTVDGKVVGVAGDVSVVDGKIVAVDGKVDTALIDIGTLDGKVVTVDGKVVTATTDIATLDGKVVTVDGKVVTATADIAVVDGKVVSVAADVTVITEDILDSYWSIVIKTANETVASSTVMQNDNHLFFAIAANEKFVFEANIMMKSLDLNDMDFTFTAPAGAAGLFGVENNQIFSAGGPNVIGPPNAAVLASEVRVTNSDNEVLFFIIKGVIINGATAGNLQFQWAQGVSDTEVTTVYTGSHLKYIKVL